MTALDELRAAMERERRHKAIPGTLTGCRRCAEVNTETDAALARVEAELAAAHRLYLEACECGSGHARIAAVEAELAELRQRPTLEQAEHAVRNVLALQHGGVTECVVGAIRALYGEAKT